MRKLSRITSLVGLCGLFALSESAWSQRPEYLVFRADMYARHEVPAISEFGSGYFYAALIQTAEENTFTWELEYPPGLGVTQAHLHFGQPGVNGGIMIFLCSNLDNGPAGTKPCPDGANFEDPVTGFVTGEEIIGPTSQGMPAGSFFEFQRALRQGVVYANIHSASFPGGVLRGQLRIVEPAD